ncbi:PREDICTED: uncharacterized protein LOC106815652 isoform X2 [Priapulus caudatus]|uniref:Uncharacterized protein LOC106815652 isoform X2 n=1 Tax=Priapulus caudatus TaxID=37621 RepID=A0ABM1ETV9_PRICU|nr:PREDICTED: uncharacterized protein LOC106815652 isoform X2 [Priapulus caudatus]
MSVDIVSTLSKWPRPNKNRTSSRQKEFLETAWEAGLTSTRGVESREQIERVAIAAEMATAQVKSWIGNKNRSLRPPQPRKRKVTYTKGQSGYNVFCREQGKRGSFQEWAKLWHELTNEQRNYYREKAAEPKSIARKRPSKNQTSSRQKEILEAAWEAGMRSTGVESHEQIERVATAAEMSIAQVKSWIGNKKRSLQPPRPRKRKISYTKGQSGYNIFCKEQGTKGDFQEWAKLWHELSNEQRNYYKEKAAEPKSISRLRTTPVENKTNCIQNEIPDMSWEDRIKTSRVETCAQTDAVTAPADMPVTQVKNCVANKKAHLLSSQPRKNKLTYTKGQTPYNVFCKEQGKRGNFQECARQWRELSNEQRSYYQEKTAEPKSVCDLTEHDISHAIRGIRKKLRYLCSQLEIYGGCAGVVGLDNKGMSFTVGNSYIENFLIAKGSEFRSYMSGTNDTILNGQIESNKDKPDLRSQVQHLFNQRYQEVTNTTKRFPYKAMREGKVIISGLPAGIKQAEPSSYGAKTLKKILEAKDKVHTLVRWSNTDDHWWSDGGVAENRPDAVTGSNTDERWWSDVAVPENREDGETGSSSEDHSWLDDEIPGNMENATSGCGPENQSWSDGDVRENRDVGTAGGETYCNQGPSAKRPYLEKTPSIKKEYYT